MPKQHYSLKPVTTPLPSKAKEAGETAGTTNKALKKTAGSAAKKTTTAEQTVPQADPFVRAEAEDDDGYDPYSDRPPMPEAQFQENPWR